MANFKRLRKNWEFQGIIQTRKQVVSKNLVLYYQKHEELLVGISIPKKNSNAVQRNYYKRQLKNILRNLDLQNLNFKIVLIARKSFLELSFSEKEKEVSKVIERLKLEKE